jgi:hypothetical protein
MYNMEKVAILTQSQKEELNNQLFDSDSYFNPIKDCNDNWIISSEEIEECINPLFNWVKTLELIDFCKPIYPSPNGGLTEYVGS